MDIKKVAVQQSNDLIRGQVNHKLRNNLQTVLKDCNKFQAKNSVTYKDLSELSVITAEGVVKEAVNRYLAKKDADKSKAMSSILAQMGGSLFQNFRIYRDILYTKQIRKERLLTCLRGQLYKALTNRDEGTAYT